MRVQTVLHNVCTILRKTPPSPVRLEDASPGGGRRILFFLKHQLDTWRDAEPGCSAGCTWVYGVYPLHFQSALAVLTILSSELLSFAEWLP